MITTTEQGQFEKLCGMEPRLQALYKKAKGMRDDPSRPSFCANAVWFGALGEEGLRGEMARLVGWFAENPELRTTEAYDIAYETLYQALPNCRACGCMAFEQAVGLRDWGAEPLNNYS